MPAATRQRRKIKYQSLEELLADADRCVQTNAATLGNWSLGQILDHLARGMKGCIDGIEFDAPWLIRLLAPYLLRGYVLTYGLSPGFKLPKNAEQALIPPPDFSAADALANLHRAVNRMNHEAVRTKHAVFGKMTIDEWDRFHLRHAELHMSFVDLPVGAEVDCLRS